MNISSQPLVFRSDFTFFDHISLDDKSHFLAWAAADLVGCVGVKEYELSEAEIDQILGDMAFSGSSVDLATYEIIEQRQQEFQKFCSLYLEAESLGETQEILRSSPWCEIGVLGEALPLVDTSWEHEWKKYFAPIDIDQSLSVVPLWWESEHVGAHAEVVLKMNPGQAFGTGQHATTFLCLKFLVGLKNLVAANNAGNFLDFGCGSGILGVAYKKFRPTWNFDFVDIEELALEESKKHHEYNEMNLTSSHFYLGENFSFKKNKYDVIVANILLNTIVDFLPLLLSSLKGGGFLILSGVLESQEEELMTHVKNLSKDAKFICERRDGWIGLQVQVGL
ncbi:MAG: 50S ribosomal protein L11 methyltransferase [Bacteriovoracaceae bacterium]|nr:50S ribosomal protein L11 methyltransferase [Bacteriovoracaceae bacterium]